MDTKIFEAIMTGNNSLCQNLYQACKVAYADKSRLFIQNKTNELRSKLKNEAKNELELENITTVNVKNLKERGARTKSKYTSFFLQKKKCMVHFVKK